MRIPTPDKPTNLLPTRKTKHGVEVAIPTRGLIVVSWSEIDTARQLSVPDEA